MDLIKGIFLLIMIVGIILLAIYYIVSQETSRQTNIIYKYLPRTLEEEETSPIYVSDIFKAMFTQPSVWIDSINENEERKNEAIDKFYISQM